MCSSLPMAFRRRPFPYPKSTCGGSIGPVRMVRRRYPAIWPAFPAEELEEIRSEIVLHMERLGDRRFPGRAGSRNRGEKLRIEAFSIRPVDTLLARRDIEFKALGPKGRQTPWVTDAKLCGGTGARACVDGVRDPSGAACRRTVRRRLPGRLLRERHCGPARQWRTLYSADYDDPLEAINVRLIRRSRR